MTIYNKCLEIFNDENPVIAFEHTYHMRDMFKRMGAICPETSKWLLSNKKYRVNHGKNWHTGKIYITQNEMIQGQLTPKIEDIVEAA